MKAIIPPKTYQDECRRLRMHLIDLLSRPSLGQRSWMDTLRIGDALMELDRQAQDMDREKALHNRSDGEQATPAGAEPASRRGEE